MLIPIIHKYLAELGCTVSESPAPASIASSILELEIEGAHWRFAIHNVRRAPYPSEVARLESRRAEISDFGHPMIVAPYISSGQGKALTEAGWSWADKQGNLDLRNGSLRLKQRISDHPPTRKAKVLPGGSGSWAIMRLLVYGSPYPLYVTELAEMAEVSQPRVSQVLARLAGMDLANRTGGFWAVNREALLEAMGEEYSGYEGHERLYYGLDSPVEFTLRISENTPDHIRISADVAADMLVPWKSPTHTILYVSEWPDASDLQLIEVDHHAESTVIIRQPADDSVFRIKGIPFDYEGHSLSLVHPTQIYLDLHELGGQDREEHAHRLKSWILRRTGTI